MRRIKTREETGGQGRVQGENVNQAKRNRIQDTGMRGRGEMFITRAVALITRELSKLAKGKVCAGMCSEGVRGLRPT